MKKMLFTAVMLLVAVMANAKDIKTVVLTTDPIMHCANCEAKIKENLKYCKGIKSIETSVPNQTVTIQYDADKTKPEAFINSLKKANYTATEKKAGCCKAGAMKEGSCCKAGATKEGSCCKEGAKKEGGCCGGCKSGEKKESSCCKSGEKKASCSDCKKAEKKADATTGATKQNK